MFSLVTPQDLRFRFFGGIGKVSHERLVAMTRFDHRSTENYLVFAGDTNILIASAMMACDASGLKAEVAIAVNAQYKNRGRCIGVASVCCRCGQSKRRPHIAVNRTSRAS
ncbi:hypothetical protein A6U84_25255 (plasmid) [Agrobacterium sp. 13-2099-1-2]|nr:hypothetical protein [Agrobacterium sp. 13-2099-1-2]UZX45143.1 hypothetical protein A6U84_25255 [Agrobacterium sp. 13-2099-1-2]